MKNKIFFILFLLFGIINNNLYAQVCPNCINPVVYGNNITNHSVDLNWIYDSYVDYYVIRYREIGSTSWSYSSSINNTFFQLSALQPNTNYEYQIKSFCGYYDAGWSCSYYINTLNLIQDCNGTYGGSAFIDNCGSCVGGNTGINSCFFDPHVDISISDNSCDSLVDLSITVSQTAFQTDMSLSNFTSNDGLFNFNNISIGDTIGNAYMNTAGGSIVINSLIIVNSIVSPNEIVANAYDTTYNINVGAFTMYNQQSLAPTPPGVSYNGIGIIASSIVDGNNTTAGNFSNINFENIFINPSNNNNFD